jgi:hypothetical protein
MKSFISKDPDLSGEREMPFRIPQSGLRNGKQYFSEVANRKR